jgi:ABC-2 type transport system ATP-binding protein
MIPAIELHDLTRWYGRTLGIDALELTVEPGVLFGFLGPNGSGKTTTIRVLLDLIRPTRGRARVLGRPASDPRARAKIGHVPGELWLDPRMTGAETLHFFAALGTGPSPGRRGELCERLGLPGADLGRKVREYSRGMKQKVALVAAFEHDPDLLVLDEPTTALDPLVREVVFALMSEASRRGATVFHSSHVLSEVERTCQRVAILRRGRLAALMDVMELRRSTVRRMVVEFAAAPAVEALLLPGIELVERQDRTVVLRVTGSPAPLLRALADQPVENVVFPESSLEEAFAAYYASDDVAS